VYQLQATLTLRIGISYERVRGTLWCHLCGATVHRASYGSSTPDVFLVPLVQVIVSTQIRVFDYVICVDQKYDSRGFILCGHLNQWQATRGVRQFSKPSSPIRQQGGLFFVISWTSHAL